MAKVITTVSIFTARHPEVGRAFDKVVSSLTVKEKVGVGGQTPKSLPVSGSAEATVYVKGSSGGISVGVDASITGKAGPVGGQAGVDVPIVKDGELVNPIKNASGEISPVLGAEKGKVEGEASVGNEEATVGGTYGEGIVGGIELGAAADAIGDLGKR